MTWLPGVKTQMPAHTNTCAHTETHTHTLTRTHMCSTNNVLIPPTVSLRLYFHGSCSTKLWRWPSKRCAGGAAPLCWNFGAILKFAVMTFVWKWSLITLTSPQTALFQPPLFTVLIYSQFTGRMVMPSLSYSVLCLQFYVCVCRSPQAQGPINIQLSPQYSSFLLCMCGCGHVTTLSILLFFFGAKGQFSPDASHLFVLSVSLSCKRDVPDPRQSFPPSM